MLLGLQFILRRSKTKLVDFILTGLCSLVVQSCDLKSFSLRLVQLELVVYNFVEQLGSVSFKALLVSFFRADGPPIVVFVKETFFELYHDWMAQELFNRRSLIDVSRETNLDEVLYLIAKIVPLAFCKAPSGVVLRGAPCNNCLEAASH